MLAAQPGVSQHSGDSKVDSLLIIYRFRLKTVESMKVSMTTRFSLSLFPLFLLHCLFLFFSFWFSLWARLDSGAKVYDLCRCANQSSYEHQKKMAG